MTHTSTALKRHLLAPAVLMLSMLLTGNVFAQEAQDNSASDPIESEVNLKDVVKFNWGFQGSTQGAGTPNQAGLGFFLPMMVSDNGVLFLDVLANANFATSVTTPVLLTQKWMAPRSPPRHA
jgi:hypothetical protein